MVYIQDRYPAIFDGGGDGEKIKGSGMHGLIFEVAQSGYGSLSELKKMMVYDFLDVLSYEREQKKIISKKLKQ